MCWSKFVRNQKQLTDGKARIKKIINEQNTQLSLSLSLSHTDTHIMQA